MAIVASTISAIDWAEASPYNGEILFKIKRRGISNIIFLRIANIKAFRTGHFHNNEVLKKNFADTSNYEIL